MLVSLSGLCTRRFAPEMSPCYQESGNYLPRMTEITGIPAAQKVLALGLLEAIYRQS